jgi:hypothetical protein
MDFIQIVATIASLVCAILFFILFMKSMKLQVDIRYILLALFFVIIGNYLIMMLADEPYFIGQILMSFGFLMLFLHYEAIAYGSPNTKVMNLLITCFSASTILNIMSILYLQTPAANGLDPITTSNILGHSVFLLDIGMTLSTYLQTIMIIIIFGRAILIINRINKLAKINATRIELIAIILLLVHRSLFLFRNFVDNSLFINIMTIGLILTIIGLLLFVGNYIRNSDYIYLLPFPIHSIMVYNKSGILCYSRRFEKFNSNMINKDMLITGALTAISSLIQETLGSQARIKHINAQQYQIFFNRLPNDSGKLVVISFGETAFFKKSLERFIKNIDANLLQNINEIENVAVLETKLDSLVKKVFPYVNFII